jgi:hypothetical protein
MDQGRALQGVVGPFSAEMVLGQPTQFAVYQGKQGLQRFLVPALPFQQQLCDLIGRGFGQTWPPFRGKAPLFWTRQYPRIQRKSMELGTGPGNTTGRARQDHRRDPSYVNCS